MLNQFDITDVWKIYNTWAYVFVISLINLSALNSFSTYAQNNNINEFPMPELVKNNFLIIEIAQKMNILWILNFSMSAILDFIFSPYAPIPRCLPVLKMLFRVHTTINTHKSLGAFHVDKSNSCLLPPIFPHYLDAILDIGVAEMS